MSVIGSSILAGASGAAGGGDPVYVDDVFSTFLYTGTGSSLSINNGIDLAGEGGLVWLKSRSLAEGSSLGDTETGITKRLSSSSTVGQAVSNRLTSANSNGFTLGTSNVTNTNNSTNVSWTFRKAPGFFDVVTYTGNGVAGRTISHSLGSVPGMIIVKRTDASNSWNVFHRSLTGTHYLELENSGSAGAWDGAWNNTNPTSTHFTVGSSPTVNNNGGTYVAYVFAHDDAQFGTDEDESIIKCGSYTGGGSTSVEVNLGFEPQWVLIKSADTGYSWWMLDNMRGISAGDDAGLSPNSSANENGYDLLDLTATGFKTGTNANANRQGDTFIYMAIRRPNKPPELATEVFAMDTGSTSSTTPTFDSGFVVDAAIEDNYFHSRLMGPKSIQSYLGDRGESNDSLSTWDSNVGWGKSYNSSTLSYMFKRAPGFMDVVTYVGNDAAGRNIGHNLSAVPELMLCKVRSTSHASYSYWAVYYKSSTAGGATKYLILNEDDGETTHSTVPWNGTDPTSTQFTVYNSWAVNRGGYNYVNFLFTTLPGISKVGTYSGTGNAINIDCGFTNGARFVMIKRTNGTGDWYYWDTFNGIVSGNDSYSRLNLSPSRVTGTDYIDPNVYGFTVTSSAPAALNATGGTYLFLAIA